MPDVNQSIVLQSRTKQGQSEAVCWKRYLCLDRSMEIMEWHFWQQGKQKRFGSDKLSEKFQGIPLYRHALEKLEAFSGLSRVVVTAREALAERSAAPGDPYCREQTAGNREFHILSVWRCRNCSHKIQTWRVCCFWSAISRESRLLQSRRF